jgi:hypothetical protein
MAQRIPHVADGVLHTDELLRAPAIRVDSPAWFAWLEDSATRSFSFQGPSGTLTDGSAVQAPLTGIGPRTASRAEGCARSTLVKPRT